MGRRKALVCTRSVSFDGRMGVHLLNHRFALALLLRRGGRTARFLPRQRLHLLRLGVTLTDILIVLAILGVLSAIAGPAMVQARRRATEAVDISNLRQIGAASALYHEMSGRPAMRTTELEAAGLVTWDICQSPADGSSMGHANEILFISTGPRSRAAAMQSDYKNSYIGYGDTGFGYEAFQQLIMPFDSPGNFIALSYSKRMPVTVIGFEGTYFRLLMDGSVVKRRHRTIRTTREGRIGRGFTLYQLFADHPDEWLKKVIFDD